MPIRAVINILLALRERNRSGKGCKLDIAMAKNLFTFMYWALGNGLACSEWPVPGGQLVTGGSPRYNIYRTKDAKFIAAAPLEQKFCANFCTIIQLEPEFHDDSLDPRATERAVEIKIQMKTAYEWQVLFSATDVCCSDVTTLEAASHDTHFDTRGVFDAHVATKVKQISALPIPLCPHQLPASRTARYPELGEGNYLVGKINCSPHLANAYALGPRTPGERLP